MLVGQLAISQEYRCVLVLCDSLWIDPDGNAANGVEHAAQPDFLRIDSMVSMCLELCCTLQLLKCHMYTPVAAVAV